MEHVIRRCEPTDLEYVARLCSKHAAYERAAYDEAGKTAKLHLAIFSPDAPLHCWVVDVDRSVVGYATYTFDFSTWSAARYLHLDCLYLEEFVRGKGIGENILKTLIAEAKKHACVNIQWQTPAFNESAIRFYSRMGADSKEKQRFTLQLPE